MNILKNLNFYIVFVKPIIMKKILVLFFLISSLSYAQFSIKGTMQPVEKFSWVILYKIEGTKEIYIKNSKVNKNGDIGSFEFMLPNDAKIGSYRVKFNLKKNGFIDFFFHKENMEFSFNPKDPNNTITYKKSIENQLYIDFLTDISSTQFKIDSLQRLYFNAQKKSTEEAYKHWVRTLQRIEKEYLQKSQGTLIYDFIRAAHRYNSSNIIESPREYAVTSIDHFFDHIDFDNKTLYNSSFLIDKISDFVFHVNYSKNIEIQKKRFEEASNRVINKIRVLSFKTQVIEYLITEFSKVKNAEIVDFLFENHFDRLPLKNQNPVLKNTIFNRMRIAIGREAPDFSWIENNKELRLSKLKNGLNYLLIFYSTECSHCLREVPEVYEFMEGKEKTKVIAFAMETSDKTWLNYHKKMPRWHHVLGLEKWRNSIARDYQVNSTPSYFVLGMDKKFIAMPQRLEDLKTVLDQLN